MTLNSWVNSSLAAFTASLIAFSSFIVLGREFEYDVVDNYRPQDELDVEGVILMMVIKSSYLPIHYDYSYETLT